jgi:hypothetical protein
MSRIVWLAVAALLAAGSAAAAREPVVVVDLGADPAARDRLHPAAARLASQVAALRLAADLPAPLRAALEGEPGPPPFALELRPARAAYAAFEYERAVALLSAVESETLGRAAAAQLAPALAELYLLRGVLAVAQRDQRAALRAFALVQRLQPGLPLDPARHPPPVQAAFRAARAAPAEPGALLLATRAGAEVLLDGVPAGTAPLPDAPLEAGLHLLIIQAPGALLHAEVLEVGPGLALSRRVELQPEPPEVAARGLIAEAARNAGPARRGALARVGELCGVARLLLVEDGPRGASARLLDLRTGEVSAMAPLGEGLPEQISGWLQPAPAPLTPAPLAALAPAPESRPVSVPLYKRWWFWAGVGAALAATSLTVYASTRPHDVVCCGSGP